MFVDKIKDLAEKLDLEAKDIEHFIHAYLDHIIHLSNKKKDEVKESIISFKDAEVANADNDEAIKDV